MSHRPRKIELLAPARNEEIARQALLHGADAVYLGAAHHGARAAAGNDIASIARTATLAHAYGARVYATVNTLVYDHELKDVERLVADLYHAGVDALIVQDLGLLRLDLPPIALHASTQCDIRDAAKARWLAGLGFSRLVLAREATIAEISEIHAAVPDVELEAFVHGALCVSYSGDCQASLVTTGRSANRGECAQICRLAYDLIDGDGNAVIKGKHLLSLRDLNRLNSLEAMIDAGVMSMKIEGRLKDAAYVKNVVGAYSQALNTIITADPDKGLQRLSAGTSRLAFTPDLNASFNRGYTSYFLTPTPAEKMACHDTPKSTGNAVAVTTGPCRGKQVKARIKVPLANGDGLGYFDASGQFKGFRLNRVDGNLLIAADAINIPAGATLYRNRDKMRDDLLQGDTAVRTISVEMTLRSTPGGVIALDVTDETSVAVTAAAKIETSVARSPQEAQREKVLTKTGGTIFTVSKVTDTLGDLFVRAGDLAELRREALRLLDTTRECRREIEFRRPESPSAPWPGHTVTYHDNVANHQARQVLADHGVKADAGALEVERQQGPLTVMTTRYCLRRELGVCLKTPQGKRLKAPLSLQAPGIDFALDFDCQACRMHVKTKS